MKKLIFVATLGLLAQGAMAAANCSTNIDGTAAMTFAQNGKEIKEIVVPASCKEFTINLANTSTLPVMAMGHNVVIAKASDVEGISIDGAKAGVANDDVKPGDTRVIAHSKLVGGGQKTSVKFPVAKIKGGDYEFFCSFPGHHAKMKGKLVIK